MHITKEEQDAQKKLTAETAAKMVIEMAQGKPIVLGLGTGSTVRFFIDAIGRGVQSGLQLTAVSTSDASTEQARSFGIEVIEDYNTPGFSIDVTVDGADEVQRDTFELIKGGGGALTREEIVWEMSKKKICIVDPTKLVDVLGAFPLPVEVMKTCYQHILEKFEAKGYAPVLREREGKTFVTDYGNYILDLYLKKIDDPVALKKEIKLMLGVINVGLFVENNRPDVVVVGEEQLVIKE